MEVEDVNQFLAESPPMASAIPDFSFLIDPRLAYLAGEVDATVIRSREVLLASLIVRSINLSSDQEPLHRQPRQF